MKYNFPKSQKSISRRPFQIWKDVVLKISTLSHRFKSHNLIAEDDLQLAHLHQIEWVDCEDVYQPTQKPIQEFITERDISSDFSQVYILKEAFTSLTEHLAADTSVEHGGILFGQAYTDPEQGIYVEITAAVAAPATIGTGAHLEFTPDSWQGIMDYAKVTHPEANIVGWYHSHPNLGVFMSGTDMRTQQAFFSHPWCLSIVHDPVIEDTGYFLGAEAKRVQPVNFELVLQAH